MNYINDPNIKPIHYRDLVNAVIKSGVQPQRAYIYLASLGIKSAETRQILSDGITYGKSLKLAVNDDGGVITSVKACESCHMLQIL